MLQFDLLLLISLVVWTQWGNVRSYYVNHSRHILDMPIHSGKSLLLVLNARSRPFPRLIQLSSLHDCCHDPSLKGVLWLSHHKLAHEYTASLHISSKACSHRFLWCCSPALALPRQSLQEVQENPFPTWTHTKDLRVILSVWCQQTVIWSRVCGHW